MKKPVVICSGNEGLGNRIKRYVNALREYEEVKVEREEDIHLFNSVQPVNDYYRSLYSDTFTKAWRFSIRKEWEASLPSDYKFIDLMYHDTPRFMMDDVLEGFELLKPSREVVDKVGQFASGYEWSSVIGLHIRSWYCNRRRYHSNDIYADAIESSNPNHKVFLATDNSEVLEHFKALYGARIINYPQTLYNEKEQADSGWHNKTDDNLNALIDMILLGKCYKLIGTYGSTFTECAWYFGGGKADVVIPLVDINRYAEGFTRDHYHYCKNWVEPEVTSKIISRSTVTTTK